MAEATRGEESAQLWPLVHEQRQKVADLLATLTDEQWQAQSLCANWRVRDVVAHCLETNTMTPPRFVAKFAGAGFRFHTFSARGVARHRDESPQELLRQFRESAGRTTSPPGPKVTWLAEAVIHGEDIARPVGRRIDVSPAALVMVAEFSRNAKPLLHGKERSSGLRLRATDVEWAAGDGPEVTGPAASIILAITGRSAAFEDLSGDGLATLRSRAS